MKFVIARSDFAALIGRAFNIVAAKTTIPILSNFLIEAANDEIVITSTDLTVGLRCFAKAKILEPGATTVPAKRLVQLVRELTAQNIEFTVDSSDLVEVVADSSRFRLHGMNRSEYPSLPDLTGSVQFKVPQVVLRDMLFRTAFAVSREDNRYVLTGVCVEIKEGRVTCTGTDGKRLARSHATVEIDPAFEATFVLPIKAVDEIQKNLTDDEGATATVYVGSDKIAVEANQVTLITKLLSGDFPDVDRVIPKNSESIVPLHRDELMTLLRQVSLFTGETMQSVRFSFNDGELRLSANAMDVGEGKVSMPVSYDGPQFDIAFNPGFFLDILSHSKQEVVTIGLSDPYNPGIITDTDSSAGAVAASTPLYVLMPMRLSEE